MIDCVVPAVILLGVIEVIEGGGCGISFKIRAAGKTALSVLRAVTVTVVGVDIAEGAVNTFAPNTPHGELLHRRFSDIVESATPVAFTVKVVDCVGIKVDVAATILRDFSTELTEVPGVTPQPFNNPMQNMAMLACAACKAFHADVLRFHVPGQVTNFNVFTLVNILPMCAVSVGDIGGAIAYRESL